MDQREETSMDPKDSKKEKKMQSHQNKGRKSPTIKTPKLLQSVNKEAEKAELNTYLQEVQDFLEQPPVKNPANLSIATWIPDLQCAKVLKKVGNKWNFFGHRFMGNDVLYPEEAVYLLEIRNLEILHNDVPMSLEKAYYFLLSKSYGCSLDEYRVYAQLVTTGYRVFRHDPELIGDQGEKSMANPDQKLTSNQNLTGGVVESKKIDNQWNTSKTKTCKVQVTSKCTRFESNFSLDYLKDKGSCKVFQDLIYSNEKSHEKTESLSVHNMDIGSSSEESDSESEDDSDEDIMVIKNDKEKKKPSKQGTDDIEILTLGSSDEETSLLNSSTVSKIGAKIRPIISEDDVMIVEEVTVNSHPKKKPQEEVIIENFIPFSTSSNTPRRNMKKEKRDEIVSEDIISFNNTSNSSRGNVKTESRIEDTCDEKYHKNTKHNKSGRKNRNKLQVSKRIFENIKQDVDSNMHANNEIMTRNATNDGTDFNTSLPVSNAMDSVAQFVQGAINQLSQGLGGGNQRGGFVNHPRGGWNPPYAQNQFMPRNQFQPENMGYRQNFQNENNQGPVSNWYPPTDNSFPSPNPALNTQSPLNPAFNQLNQLNELLEGINVKIRKSVGGLYHLKRLQDPNYIPRPRPPRPRHFVDQNNAFGNYGPRYNQFNDARMQFNPRNQFPTPTNQFPPYNPNFTIPPPGYPHPNQQPFANNYPNMMPENSFPFNPEQQQQQQYGPNDYNTQRTMDDNIGVNGYVNNQMSHKPNVKEETSSSDEEDDDSDEEEENVKPNIVNSNSTLGGLTNFASTPSNTSVNIKKENQSSGKETNTHIRFNIDSSSDEDNDKPANGRSKPASNNELRKRSEPIQSNGNGIESTSEEESSDEDETTAGPPSAKKIKIEEEESTSEEESSDDDNNKVDKSSIKARLNKNTMQEDKKETSDDESSEEDSGQDSSDVSNSNTLLENFDTGLKKRTHIRFNIEDSDDEMGEKKNENNVLEKTKLHVDINTKATETQKHLVDTTDDELERENEKLIIFHSDVISPEQRNHFLTSFSSDPLDLLDHIHKTSLTNEKIKLISKKIKKSFPVKSNTNRQLLQRVLKHEQKVLKKRRYKVRKLLLRRAMRKEGSKTYIGTVLSSKNVKTCKSDDEPIADYVTDNLNEKTETITHGHGLVVENKDNEKVEERNTIDALNDTYQINENEKKVQEETAKEKVDSEINKKQKDHNSSEPNKNKDTCGTLQSNEVSSISVEITKACEKPSLNKNVMVGEPNDGDTKEEILNSKTDPDNFAMGDTPSNLTNDEKLDTSNEVTKTNSEEVHEENSEELNETMEISVETMPSEHKIDCDSAQSNSEGNVEKPNDIVSIENSQTGSTNEFTKESSSETVLTCEPTLQIPEKTPEVSKNVNTSIENKLNNLSSSNDLSKVEDLKKSGHDIVLDSHFSKEIETEQCKGDTTKTKVIDTKMDVDETSIDDNKISNLLEKTEVSNSAINLNTAVDAPASNQPEIIPESTDIKEQQLSLSNETVSSVVPLQSSHENKTVPEKKEREIETKDTKKSETGVDQDSRDNSKDTEMEIDETLREDSSKTNILSDKTEETESTLKNKETAPLIKDQEISSYGELYKKLDIFNKNPPPEDTTDLVPLTIMFDVYCASGKNFAKTKRGAPNYRVIVVQPDHELPSPGQMSELQARFRDVSSVPYVFAVVLPGAINYYRYADVFIPTLLEDLDR